MYDGEDILLEYDGPANTFVARYSHGDQVDQQLVLQKAGVGFFYYHSNHQGSITHLTDSSGTIANSYVYDSYGRQLTVFESVIQPFSYTGREYDGESGLYFYRARYFDAQTGRFLSEDPIRFRAGDQNLYRYVGNTPLNFRDPRGRFAFILPWVLPALEGGAILEGAIVAAKVTAAALLASQLTGDAEEGSQQDESSVDLPGSGASCPKQSPDRQALNDLINEQIQGGRRPLSDNDADQVLEWAKEQNIPGTRDDRGEGHWEGGDHIHVPQSGVRHIPTGGR